MSHVPNEFIFEEPKTDHSEPKGGRNRQNSIGIALQQWLTPISSLNLLSINPSEYGLTLTDTSSERFDLTRINNVEEIYREEMAPTVVSVGYDTVRGDDQLLTSFQKKLAKQEFPLHCRLNHENIVKGYDWSENEKEYVLVMEYMNKPNYFREKIDVNLSPVKNEIKMKSYVSDILESLKYLHNERIVHCDLKLENILANTFQDEDKIPIVKVCDFGLSHIKDREANTFIMEQKSGTHSYIAPEVKNGAVLDEKIDMFSLGVMLYKMAVAYKPTILGNYQYGSGPVPFRKFDWKKRSPQLQDLVAKLLEFKPEDRISAEEALDHPWFTI